MKRLLPISLFLFLSVAAISCASMKGGANKNAMTSLQEATWELQSIVGFELEETRQPVTMIFDADKRYGGHAGCNNYGGTYELSGKETITLSQSVSTRMACDIGMKTENRFLEMLSEVNGYNLKMESLDLKKDGVVIATFVKSKNY